MRAILQYSLPLFLALAALAPNAHGDAGQLDTTFNPGTGINIGLVLASAVQSNGKIIIGGSFTTYNGVAQNRIARLNADGSLDPSFAIGNGPNDQVNGIAIQPDGKIVIAGAFTLVGNVITRRIARLNANGSVDTTFNPSPAFDQTNGADDIIADVKLQADGKFIIGGIFHTYRTAPRNGVARLLADGTLDTSFNPGTGPDASVSAVAVAPDGKILIGGSFTTVSGQARRGIARLNANGTVDLSFAGPGIASGAIYDLVVDTNSRIVAGGFFVFYNTTAAKNVVRINPDGTRDPGFNSGLASAGSVSCVALQPSGKILVGGEFSTPSSPGVPSQVNLARLNNDGTIDSSFKPGSGPNLDVQTLRAAPDGNIIIGGKFATYNGVSRKGVARVVGINPPALRNISTRSVIQTGDRVTIAGFIITGNGPKQVLVRALGPSLTASGVPDALQNPVIELYNSAGALVNGNDNWRDTQQNAIAETAIPPSDDREAALLITLGPGSYTVTHSGKNATTGNGLIELYDLTGGTAAKLANISTRAFVGSGDNVMIGGFIVAGDSARVVVRALGPSLTAAGVPGALADPRLLVYDGNGVLVGFNQNWRAVQEAELTATGLQPSNDLEAAMILTIAAGNYTAVAEGSNNGTGVGLVEVYNVP